MGSPNPNQLSLELSRKARDTSLKLVAGHNDTWFVRALTQVKALRASALLHGSAASFTGEDIRTTVSRLVGPPNHSNAWGAFVHHLVRLKLIEKTGAYRQMRTKSSHARITPVYRWATEGGIA